jgi:6-pyruvoyltetrahydropterin/6-carboxytetrahydropterin synthase
MIELTRSVRMCVNHPGSRPAEEAAPPTGRRHNGFAAWPPMRGVGAWYELVVACRGAPGADTGWLLNISRIDRATREAALPILERALWREPLRDPASFLPELVEAIGRRLEAPLAWVTWRLTPYHSVRMERSDPGRVTVSQQFEFAASHRLHSPGLSADENRRLYGKCNNPTGHGHNYRVEVVVSRPVHSTEMPLWDLERIVDEQVIARFDHKNLNTDAPEFHGIIPSVEEIARVCYDLLRPHLSRGAVRLERVTVWETEKTSATYAPAPGPG